MRSKSNQGHINGLDGLRALAALSVFCVHFNQVVRLDYLWGPFDLYRLLANGEYGVSLFFSLTGFLLAMPFWKTLQSDDPVLKLGDYALKRAARIFPAYYAALTALILLSGLWKVPGAFADILMHYLFLFNYTEFSIFSINAPFWTLAVEVQFYILLPFLFLLVRKVSIGKALVIIGFLGAGAYAAHYMLMVSVTSVVSWPFKPQLNWIRPYGAVLNHSLLAHLPHFLLGVAASRLYLRMSEKEAFSSPPAKRAFESVFWISAVSVLILVSTSLEETLTIPYGRYGLPMIPLLIVMLVVSAPHTALAVKCLESYPLRILGRISYGFYIWHLPVLTRTDQYMGRFGLDAAEHWILFGFIGLLLSVVLASISYLAIEKPVLNRVKKIIK